MDLSFIIKEKMSGVELDLVVSPSSPKSEVQGIDPWRGRLVVKLRAPPEKGEANEELVLILEELFSAPVEVVRGRTSRMKTVHIALGKDRVLEILEGLHARP